MTPIRNRNRKIFAAVFLVIFSIQTFEPGIAYALTSGPSQPEMEKFEPAGTSNMVDLFTGDLKYNIPLLDVDGFPVNLSYQSGSGMEDEASWVGMGWSLNPGAVNRELRGLPDDFKGEKIQKYFDTKPKVTVGASLYAKLSVIGKEIGKAKFSLDVYKDNYTGMGASIGASLSVNATLNRRGTLEGALDAGLNSDTKKGVGLNATFKMNLDNTWSKATTGYASGSFEYTTRAGLKSTSFTASVDKYLLRTLPVNLKYASKNYYNTPYTPKINVNTKSSKYEVSLDGGPSFWGAYVGGGASGYVYKEGVEYPLTEALAYGYMYHPDAGNMLNVVQDFTRDQDGVFLESAPAIGQPNATHDLFMATGQSGSRQFRFHLNRPFIAYDKIGYTSSSTTGVGITIGGGNIFKAGGSLDLTSGNTYAGKWNNSFLDPKFGTPELKQPEDEPVYFKAVGEQTALDEGFYSAMTGYNIMVPSLRTDN